MFEEIEKLKRELIKQKSKARSEYNPCIVEQLTIRVKELMAYEPEYYI